MFEVSIEASFSSAHHLRGYNGTCEVLHGHNWKVEVFVQGEELDDVGLLVDFREVKRHVKGLLKKLDHTDLNELESFRDRNPSSENIARELFGRLSELLNVGTRRVSRVIVHETPGSAASYWETV